jgi:hypothetical protein
MKRPASSSASSSDSQPANGGGIRPAPASSTPSSLMPRSSAAWRRMSTWKMLFMNWVRVRSSMTRKATRNRPMAMTKPAWK